MRAAFSLTQNSFKYSTTINQHFVDFFVFQERLPRTTAQKCAVYEGKPCCQRQKDGCEVHSRRGGVTRNQHENGWKGPYRKDIYCVEIMCPPESDNVYCRKFLLFGTCDRILLNTLFTNSLILIRSKFLIKAVSCGRIYALRKNGG